MPRLLARQTDARVYFLAGGITMKKAICCLAAATALLTGCMAISVEEINTDELVGSRFESACEKTITDYAWHWDHFNSQQFSALFTRNAVLEIPGNRLTGRDAILEHQENRGEEFVMRHVVSNYRFERVDDDRAIGSVYVTVYGKRLADDGSVQVDGMLALAEYQDKYRWVDGHCLFEERLTRRIFAGPATP